MAPGLVLQIPPPGWFRYLLFVSAGWNFSPEYFFLFGAFGDFLFQGFG